MIDWVTLASIGLAAVAGLGLTVSLIAIIWTVINATPWGHVRQRLNRLTRFEKKSKINIKFNLDRRDIYSSLAGLLIAVTLLWGTPVLHLGAGLGILLSPVVVRLYSWTQRGRLKQIKLRECAILYEAIDLYTHAGYTVEQALKMGAALTPSIRPAVERCLAYWPQGPLRALERMGGDIGLEEAEILISVLMQAVKAGPERVAGLLGEESVKLEELRQTMAEIKIAAKPIYMTAYYILPLAANMGIVLSTLGYRILFTLDGMKAGM
ncbi:MAG: hypothetical protein VR67_17540 [Peptococcaceae bacterium BRH_c8a]|nr:MAG: hypothetical protein VR67_17540 [Peptococcaceae bacterium BRH_c8a]